VPIGEDRAFLGEAVDVEGLVAHHPVAVAADVPVSDVVSPNDEDVWLVRLRHMTLLGFGFLVSNCPLCQKSPLFEPLYETQQHGDEREDADQGEDDCHREQRGLLSLTCRSRYRGKISTPEVADAPVV